MPKYKIKDEKGNVKEISQEEYKKEYTRLLEANRIGIDEKNLLPGQQARPQRNKAAGLIYEPDMSFYDNIKDTTKTEPPKVEPKIKQVKDTTTFYSKL